MTSKAARRFAGWAALASFLGVAASTGAARAAITSTNTTNDSTSITYAYQYSLAGTWFRVYIDTDRNAATGFPAGTVGADYMLEGGILYQFVGPGWAWNSVGAATYSNAASTATWTIARASIGKTNCTTESADVVFQVEVNGGAKETSSKLTHAFIPCASAVFDDRFTNDATSVFYRFQYTSAWSLFQVYIDTDRNAATGYATNGMGADYFIEGGTLRQHTGGASSWTWNTIGPVTYGNTAGAATWTVARSAMGETLTEESANVLFRVQSSSTSATLPIRTHIYFGSTGTGGTGGSGGAGGPTGTIVPLYTYPTSSTWSSIISAKNAHPTVPVVAIVNPASGPGASVDSNYTTGIANLHAAGIKVIGYVATGYTARAEATVQADMDKWRTFYPVVEGIFFDEMSNHAGDEGYYRRQDAYARTKGFTYTVGNPGTDTLPSFVGTVNTILVYESSGTAPLGTWYTSYARDNFGVIPYNVPSLDTAYVTSAKQKVGYIYMTHDNLPNPWDSLSSYFSALLDALM